MQINSVVNSKIIQQKQNFKGSSATSSPLSEFQSAQQIPLNASKAYASPQITQGYKELQTFEVPYIGQGKSYALANGHKIIIVPKVGKTYISTIVGVGQSDETAEKRQISHLTEHLLANYWHNASQNSDITKTLKETGAYSNAGTGDSFTTYYTSANVQSNYDLENLIKIQLGILTNNSFSGEAIKKEKIIILNEATERDLFTDEENQAFHESIKNLFGLNAANGMASEQTAQKVEEISKGDLIEFYNNFYRPDNMTTVIIGNIDTDSIKTVSKYFNKMSNPKQILKRENAAEIKEKNYISGLKRSDLESKKDFSAGDARVELSFIGPKITDMKNTQNVVILTKIIESRLQQQKIDITTSIPTLSKDKNVPQLIFLTNEYAEKPLEENINKLCDAVKDLVQTPISTEELNIAKKQVLEESYEDLEKNKTFAGVLNDSSDFDSKLDIKANLNQIKNVTPNELQKTALQYLNMDKASLVVIHHNNSEDKKTNQVAFKGIASSEEVQDVEEYNLPNNLHVIVDTRPGIINSAISFNFTYEGPEKINRGIIDMLNSTVIKNKNNKFPAGTWVVSEGIVIRKYGFSDDLKSIVNEAKNELLSPEFDKKAIDKAKNEQQENIKSYMEPFNEKDLNKLSTLYDGAVINWKEGVCPPDATIDDLKKYYNNFLTKSQGVIIITTPKEIFEENKTEIFKNLNEIPTIKPQDFSKIANQINPVSIENNKITTRKYSLNQNSISITKDYKIIHNGNTKEDAAMYLLNSIIDSKLEKKLREDLGLTYNAYSRYDNISCKHGVFSISSEVSKAPLTENTKLALIQINQITQDLIDSKIDNPTLNSTKKEIIAKLIFPDEKSQNRNLDMADLYKKSYNYNINHQQKLIDEINKMTAEDLQKIAKKYLKTNHFWLDISGNKEAIEKNKDYLTSLGEIAH